MNSLEFIEKEIARTKSKHKEHIKFGQTAFAIKDEKRLRHLKQIKCELEAWESIKSGLIYEEQSKYRMSEEMRRAFTVYLTDDEMESIQKALEVEDNA